MKKITFSCIFLLLLITNSKAQFNELFSKNYNGKDRAAGVYGYGLAGSDAITVKFQNAYINNEFISNDLKDDSFNGMDDRSVQASQLNAGLWYRQALKDSSHGYWFVALRHREHFNSNFTKDLFGLYFYGNKPYAGKTADLSDLNYRSITWQQAEVGLNKRFGNDSCYWQFTGGISILNGQQYLDFTTGRGSFYTHPDADYVQMDLYLESKQSDSSDYKFGASNGFGLSVDLMASYTTPDYVFSFGVKDAGFIHWNNSSFNYTVDTLYKFEGAVSGNFFDSLYLDIATKEDFVNGFRQDYVSGAFNTTLPVWVGAAVERKFKNDLFSVFAGADYIINADYSPHFRLGGSYHFNSRIVGSLAVNAGGYADYGFELYGGFDLSHGWILTAGSAYVGGFVFPSAATARSASLGIEKLF